MRSHQQVLYATEGGTRLGLADRAIEVRRDDGTDRVPLHHVQSVVCWGAVPVSAPLLAACAAAGIGVVFLSFYGRFQARVEGPVSGNVLLRLAQLRACEGPAGLEIARSCVLGKLGNARALLRRGAREAPEHAHALGEAADGITAALHEARRAGDADSLRGWEGRGAALAFGVFDLLLRGDPGMRFVARSRRPPRDEVNAALSFLYALLCADGVTAAQAAGLDPQVGFLHGLRPGRPALALDLMEELRPTADRALLSLVNQRQLQPKHFDRDEAGAVLLNDAGRRVVLTAWSLRKRRELRHPFLNEQTTWALVPHIQARILARHLRGDLDAYVPYLAQG